MEIVNIFLVLFFLALSIPIIALIFRYNSFVYKYNNMRPWKALFDNKRNSTDEFVQFYLKSPVNKFLIIYWLSVTIGGFVFVFLLPD